MNLMWSSVNKIIENILLKNYMRTWTVTSSNYLQRDQEQGRKYLPGLISEYSWRPVIAPRRRDVPHAECGRKYGERNPAMLSVRENERKKRTGETVGRANRGTQREYIQNHRNIALLNVF